MSFKDKVILITGANSGIGAALAEYLASDGALLALTGRSAEKFEKVIEKIKENGVEEEPLVILADIRTDCERIMTETIEKYGKLDILINNAGYGTFASIETVTMVEYDKIMSTNVRAVLELTQLAVPHLAETKGNIVNISSTCGVLSAKNFLVYSMSKSALDQFTKCVAMELAEKGIRVNSVNPGAVDTEFYDNNFGTRESEAYEAFLEACRKIYPIGRIGTLDDCVNAISFIASDNASFITGAILLVDGGLARKGAF